VSAAPPAAATARDPDAAPAAAVTSPVAYRMAVVPPCQAGIRTRSTVGSSVTSVARMVPPANPRTFSTGWARASAPWSAGPTAPLPTRAPRAPPATTAPQANR